jgi:hypothetical protein
MGVASKRSAFIGSKNFENGLKLTNQNGTTSFVNGKVVLFVMSLQIIMMFQWGLTL